MLPWVSFKGSVIQFCGCDLLVLVVLPFVLLAILAVWAGLLFWGVAVWFTLGFGGLGCYFGCLFTFWFAVCRRLCLCGFAVCVGGFGGLEFGLWFLRVALLFWWGCLLAFLVCGLIGGEFGRFGG